MTDDSDKLLLDSHTRALVDGLPPAERERLEALMTQAAARQRTMLKSALEDAVRMVPGPLRKRVEKMFPE